MKCEKSQPVSQEKKKRKKIEVYTGETTGKYKNKCVDIRSNTPVITININVLNVPPR